jgi:NADH-quinone oxidoreductase subunit L
VPLIVLAFLSIVGGFVGIPASLGGGNAIEQWLDPVFERAQGVLSQSSHPSEVTEYLLMILSVGVAVAGIYLARTWYLRRKEVPEKLSERLAGGYRLLLNKYYVDEAYDTVIVKPLQAGSDKLLWKGVDIGIIDWCINTGAKLIGLLSRTVRVVQTGLAQSYVFVFVLGVVAILGWMLAH